jgi:beta-galactosidase
LSPLEVGVRRPLPEGKAEAVRIWGWHDEHRSWTWPGAEGRALTISIYTQGDRVELNLNGRMLGRQSLSDGDGKHLELSIPYEPGTLEVVAFRKDAEIARRRLTTAGTPVTVRLVTERPKGKAQLGSVCYIGVEILDAANRLVPDALHTVALEISGPVALAAFGSASPLAVGSFRSNIAQTWDGRALIILRSTGREGVAHVRAQAEGLRGDHVELPLV